MHHIAAIIDSMSEREKYYFTKLYKDRSEKNFYKLYKYIEQHPRENLQDWRYAFAGTALGNNISTEVNYLYQNILRCLHIYRLNSKDPRYSIPTNLQHVQILIEKERYKEARKILLKTKAMAYRQEQYALLVKIISTQEELEVSLVEPDLSAKIDDLQQEREQCLAVIQNYYQIRNLYAQLLSVQYLDEVANINHPVFSNSLLDDMSVAKSLNAQEIWLAAKGQEKQLQGLYDEAYQYHKARVDLLEANDSLFPKVKIILALNNTSCLFIDKGDYQEARNMYRKLVGYSTSPELDVSMMAFFVNYLGIMIEAYDSNEAALLDMIPTSLKELRATELQLNQTQIAEWTMSLLRGMLITRQFAEAMSLLNIWEQGELKKYTLKARKVIKMICTFELQEYDLLKIEMKSFRKHVYNADHPSRVLIALLSFFTNALTGTQTIKQLSNQLMTQCQEMQYDRKEIHIFNKINLLQWATNLHARS